MANEFDNNAYKNENNKSDGEVMIANDVIATIACIAATEIKGVAMMSGNLTNEIICRLGVKNSSKGAKIEIEDGLVYADLSVTTEYGYSIPKICSAIQERVSSAIKDMTGLHVAEVNVHIVGVSISK